MTQTLTSFGNLAHKAWIAWTTLRELGLAQTASYAQYRLGMRSGWISRQVERGMHSAQLAAVISTDSPTASDVLNPNLVKLPAPSAVRACLAPAGWQALFGEADEILAGQTRLFGGLPEPIQLANTGPLEDWTSYEGRAWLDTFGDIKLIWEPGRFGWAVTLARAHLADPQTRYSKFFWQQSAAFLDATPPGKGPHWSSAQEVGLRLVCLALAWQVFGSSAPSAPTGFTHELYGWLAAHAARIPPSLSYARSQNNNHLLSEAAGLYTAGLWLHRHPSSKKWRELGWKTFHTGLRDQVYPSGDYSQHSVNYHRLMLQLSLWMSALASQVGETFPPESAARLAVATDWLAALVDETSGQLPNLGANDGANILPLSSQPYADYRPTLQAAGRVFLGKELLPPGPWDEMSLWLAPAVRIDRPQLTSSSARQGVLRSPNGRSWGYLRAAHFNRRPGHADQLHVDLWWRGINIALDAGTYVYNAPPPWDNTLACAQVHNTITLDGQDQMLRAGRFLYLRRAQADYTERLVAPDASWERLTARHSGYLRLGAWHVRTLARLGDAWQVEDQLLPVRAPAPRLHQARLHWLLPDWDWQIEQDGEQVRLELDSPGGRILLLVTPQTVATVGFLLARAGEFLAGEGAPSPIMGWRSPTYHYKEPALSLAVSASGCLPFGFTSLWQFPET